MAVLVGVRAPAFHFSSNRLHHVRLVSLHCKLPPVRIRLHKFDCQFGVAGPNEPVSLPRAHTWIIQGLPDDFGNETSLSARIGTKAKSWNNADQESLEDVEFLRRRTLQGTCTLVQKFISDNFLPLVLLVGVLAGYLKPAVGQLANQCGLTRFSTFGIFLISGLSLKWGELKSAFHSWPAFLYGLTAILLITPLASFVALRLPLSPPELSAGLAVFCCVPTTLSTGVALTQAVGGNTALALALTVTSNLLGIATMPFVLSAMVGRGVGVSLPALQLLKSLLQTLLLPLMLGMALRRIGKQITHRASNAPDWVDGNKKRLSMLSSVLLSLVPWMQVSSAHVELNQIAPFQLLVAAMAGMALHASFVVFNSWAVHFVPLTHGVNGKSKKVKRGLQRAVILVASQKTLPVAVAVVGQLKGVLGSPGLLLLPCIATQLIQTILDSLLVKCWLKSDLVDN